MPASASTREIRAPADASACTLDQRVCDGACTHPAGNAGAICRVDAGQCDVVATCDRVAPACPADGLEPTGTPCDDGAACTIGDACSGGVCAGDPMTCGDGTVQGACGEECDDANATADDGRDTSCLLEPCAPAPDPLCKQPFISGKASIKLKDDSGNGKDSLLWKWSAGSQTDASEFGDPVNSDD